MTNEAHALPDVQPDALPDVRPDAVPDAQPDVLIIGGGAAGLAAGLMLGRSRRSVLIIDGGEPRNAPAHGVHGYLTREGIAPAELVRIGRAEVEQYGGVIRAGHVVTARRDAEGNFVATLSDGGEVRARRLVIATGLKDELPDIPGLVDLWGTDVLHCPYCHGWEVRDKNVGVLATGPNSMHQVSLFRQLTTQLTFFLNDVFEPSDEQWEQLAARGIRVVTGPVARIDKNEGGRMSGLALADGTPFALDALVVGTRVVARAEPFADLGLDLTELPLNMGVTVAVTETGATSVPGVWAVGNVSDARAQVSHSAAAGSFAGAHINADLVSEDTARDVAAHRARAAAPSPAAV